MATYTGLYAADTSPIIDRFEPGRAVFVEATLGFAATYGGATFFNTGGTYFLIRIPPYARLIDVSMTNTVLSASSAFAADLDLIIYDLGLTPGATTSASSIGTIFTGNCTDWCGTAYVGMRSLRGKAMLNTISATAAGLSYAATNLPDFFCGASAVFNVSATQKFIALVTSATLNSVVGSAHYAASTAQYIYVSAEYHMLNNAAAL